MIGLSISRHKTNTLLVVECNLMRSIDLVTAANNTADFLHIPWCEKNHVLSYSLHSLIRFFYHYYYYYYCHGAIDYSHATCFSLGIETSTVLKIFNQVYICIWVTHLHEVTLQQPTGTKTFNRWDLMKEWVRPQILK